MHERPQVINLDNDKPGRGREPFVVRKPCDVPRRLRDAVKRVAGNFSALLLTSIRAAEPLLAKADYDFLTTTEKLVKKAERYAVDLAAQFSTCGERAGIGDAVP